MLHSPLLCLQDQEKYLALTGSRTLFQNVYDPFPGDDNLPLHFFTKTCDNY